MIATPKKNIGILYGELLYQEYVKEMYKEWNRCKNDINYFYNTYVKVYQKTKNSTD